MPDEKNQQKNMVPRPPIVCVMGHVDHGKSTLLDYIRKTNLAEKETGGITQKIGAYEVGHTKSNGGKKLITFLDTPGHEAFGAIRSRGASVADIAILVVSAEDGVMPQTLDAYSCIKNAHLPFIIAINKIDRPGADIEKTKQSLAENEIYIEGYGGDIPWVAISAKSGVGIPELLELIDLVAEMNNFSGTPEKKASGFIVEANFDNRRGPTATAIIKDGTLKYGEVAVTEKAFATIKMMEDDHGKTIKEARMGTPVRIVGWNILPEAGSTFKIVSTKKEAESLIEKKLEEENERKTNLTSSSSVQKSENENQITVIPVIIKADATGTIDAINHELKKIKNDRVEIKIIDNGVGDIAESDAKKAESITGSLIIGFNVKIDSRAKNIIERSEIEVKQFDIIYKLSEWLIEFAKKRTPKIKVEEKTGTIKILKIFNKEKDRQIIGGKVLDGQISVGSEVIIKRREEEIGRGKIRELQKQKTKTDEVGIGMEFGAMVEAKVTIAPGDIVEPFTIVEK